MDELRRAARRARREILGLDEEDAFAVPYRLTEDAGAGDPTADDDEIPGLCRGGSRLVAVSRQPHERLALLVKASRPWETVALRFGRLLPSRSRRSAVTVPAENP